MTRIFGGLIAAAVMLTGMASIVVADSALPMPAAAANVAAPSRIVTTDAQGRPLLLARMVVTATVLAR